MEEGSIKLLEEKTRTRLGSRAGLMALGGQFLMILATAPVLTWQTILGAAAMSIMGAFGVREAANGPSIKD